VFGGLEWTRSSEAWIYSSEIVDLLNGDWHLGILDRGRAATSLLKGYNLLA
jgi:hypothetical protein